MKATITKPSDHFVAVGELRKLRPDMMPKAGNLTQFNQHYSVKPGNTTIVTGYPSSGKSFLIINMLMALSISKGWKHLLYTPEMGEPEEIVITLLEVRLGARIWNITENQISSEIAWLSEHFSIVSYDHTPTMRDMLLEVEKQRGFNTFVIDNLNDLSHSISGTQDIYWESQIVEFNRTARKTKMHGFLSAHPGKPQPDDLLAPPGPDKIKGGSAFWSKGQSIISLHRKDTELTINFAKIKPRIIGKTGQIQINVDLDRNTYYEWFAGSSNYMFDQVLHLKQDQKPSSTVPHPDLRIQSRESEDFKPLEGPSPF